jgi:hypothetical protein
MSRRSRSGTADTLDEAAKLTLAELESLIARCIWGVANGGTSQGRKAYFKRLVRLEQQREELHGVSAPRRSFSTRRQED